MTAVASASKRPASTSFARFCRDAECELTHGVRIMAEVAEEDERRMISGRKGCACCRKGALNEEG